MNSLSLSFHGIKLCNTGLWKLSEALFSFVYADNLGYLLPFSFRALSENVRPLERVDC